MKLREKSKMLNHCKSDQYYPDIQRRITALDGKRLQTTENEPVGELIFQIQRQLHELGFLVNHRDGGDSLVTGRLNRETRVAIAEFVRSLTISKQDLKETLGEQRSVDYWILLKELLDTACEGAAELASERDASTS